MAQRNPATVVAIALMLALTAGAGADAQTRITYEHRSGMRQPPGKLQSDIDGCKKEAETGAPNAMARFNACMKARDWVEVGR